MYLNFQMATPSASSPGDRGGRPGSSKRVTISNACVECRRRKIKCDGAKPCLQCQYYGETCEYSKPSPRTPLTKKIMDKVQAERDRYRTLLSRLFAGQDLDSLLVLSRAELVEIILRPVASRSPSSSVDSGLYDQVAGLKSESAESLDALDQAPNFVHDEVARHKIRIDGIADDINGLSFSVDRQSSYVGVSSIAAALKVIVKTAPIAQDFLTADKDDEAPNSGVPREDPDPYELPEFENGQLFIDSFFTHVHPFMPMIDEEEFRRLYSSSRRRDTPWFALLNMVFALGSLSSATCTNIDHLTFYLRARKHLDIEAFGSGSIDVLRAMGLMGGYYLHWLNRPNEANGIMGAALRMALALGLHREFNHIKRGQASADDRDTEISDDVRRRTWWSLYCLDSWASIPTGRPTLGRGGLGVMVESPRIPQLMNPKSAGYEQSLKLLPIVYNTSLCKIATRVQDFLAVSPLIKFDTLLALDAELERWRDELPSALTYPTKSKKRCRSGSNHNISPKRPSSRGHDECPEILKIPRAVMHWRYHNVRILLHRPFLLAAALRKSSSFANLTTEEQVSVSKCRSVAGETLTHIEQNLADDLIAGWNAVWLAYQAVMVPLVYLFSILADPFSPASTPASSPQMNENLPYQPRRIPEDINECSLQIETAIRIFDRMQPFSVAAKKSKDIVERLYSAGRYAEQQYHLHHPAAFSPSQFQTLSSTLIQPPITTSPPETYYQDSSFPMVSNYEPHPSIALPSSSSTAILQPFAYDPTSWQYALQGVHGVDGGGGGVGGGGGGVVGVGGLGANDDPVAAAAASGVYHSLETLEWDASVPPGDLNAFMDPFDHEQEEHQQQHQHQQQQQQQHQHQHEQHQQQQHHGGLDWGSGREGGGGGGQGQGQGQRHW